MPYPELPGSLVELEESTLDVWRSEDLFRRTLEWTEGGTPFVFYEGPPTANGRPGFHHIISRTIKDLFCRYQTQNGRSVTRIAGWDTHGLPVELETEKRLGISGKPDIERLGIARFNAECKDSVWTYREEWERLSERIGYWLDYSRPYVTYHTSYIESVWAILAELAGKDLLYRGHKSVPYCPRCGTALSSHEVSLGYKDVEDPSLYFTAALLNGEGAPDPQGRRFVVWTTTPWTVPSNTALAVHPDLEYVEVDAEGGPYIVAASRVEALFGEDARVGARHQGADMVGWRYQRPLDLVPVPEETGAAWTVLGEDFVSAEDGTGLVHLAPAFGADDYQAGQRHGLPLLNPVDDEGRFEAGIAEVGGQFVKDADERLLALLNERGGLFKAERMLHSYPHCWRCQSPLIYMARASWFAATSSKRDALLANNESVSWNPPEVGSGRFGEWLKGNVDWALSRDRFWGTPLPVWLCDAAECTEVQWIGSLEALAEHAGPLAEDFDPHRPTIDEVTWACSCGGTMRRTPEVIDVWFDSGAMPYAQWHYPFENHDEFDRHFPADFICEGLDQTRGWFYSLMAIATLLDRGAPFKNVIVNGLILDAKGQKMSKTRGNAVDPWEAIQTFGADGLRWYLMTVSHPGTDKRYDPEVVAESTRRFFDTVFNTYRFFSMYANLEGWTPSAEDPAPADRPLLDRWLLERVDSLVREVRTELDAYQVTTAYRAVQLFVDDDLSNWYVRRSRGRFWNSDDAADQRAAFATLWEALRALALLIAPVAPFAADWLHRALSGDSAHLTAFPQAPADASADTLAVASEMDAVRALSRLGRAAREEVKIRVRQPLGRVQAVTPGAVRPRSELIELLKDELNVKEVEFLNSAEGLVSVEAKPNYRVLGPRFQKRTEQAAQQIRALDDSALSQYLSGEDVAIEVDGERFVLQPGEVDVVEEAGGGLTVQSDAGYTAALDPTLDDALIQEGLARELVNRIQRFRRDAGLEVSDRIVLGLDADPEVLEAAREHEAFVCGETLALSLSPGARDQAFDHQREVELDGRTVWLALSRSGREGPSG